MTSRQIRRERRAAERKAKKAELKRLKTEGADAGFVSQSGSVPQITDSHASPRPSHVCERAVFEVGFASRSAGPNNPDPLPNGRFVSQNGPAEGETIIQSLAEAG